MATSSADANPNITAESLAAKLKEELPAEHVEMRWWNEAVASSADKVDSSANRCGNAFEAVIVSSAFSGKKLLARHRLVNTILKTELENIHAFSQKAYTPEEYEKKVAGAEKQ